MKNDGICDNVQSGQVTLLGVTKKLTAKVAKSHVWIPVEFDITIGTSICIFCGKGLREIPLIEDVGDVIDKESYLKYLEHKGYQVEFDSDGHVKKVQHGNDGHHVFVKHEVKNTIVEYGA